jgi:NADPH:quinone reductase-like Zn-dependent oxidoreductase
VVGGPAKIGAARAAGAVHVIDKSGTALWPAVERLASRGVDVVCDANGPETLRASYDHLAPGGKLVVYGFHTMFARGGGGRPDWLRLAVGWLRTPRFSPLDMTTRNRSVLAFNLSFMGERLDVLGRAMQELLDAAAAGALAPLPVRTLPFESAVEAHRALESGTTTGKLVLEI